MANQQGGSPSIILFDGICNFCSASVNFIILRDAKERFHFAPLQSNFGKAYLSRFPELKSVNSIILIEGERHYVKSSAILKILRHLDGLWKIFYILIIFPKPLRDPAYCFFARNRYRWFGKQETCMVPTQEISRRFLADE